MDASSGEQFRHRLSRAGNRRINHVLHIMAIVQLRNDTLGRAYYRQMLADQLAGVTSGPVEAGPGGHTGATPDSSADDLATPAAVSSDTSLPGPPPTTLPPTTSTATNFRTI